MARLNITLNQDEILQLLSVDREDAFRVLLQDNLNRSLRSNRRSSSGPPHTSVQTSVQTAGTGSGAEISRHESERSH